MEEEEEEEEEIECRTEEPTEAQKYARKKRIPLKKDLFGWLAHGKFFSRSNEAFALKRRFAQKQQKEEGN